MHTHWSQFVPNMSTRHPRTLSSASSSIVYLSEHEPVWPSGKALGWYAETSRFDSASALFVFKKVVVCGHCVVTLSLTINETLKWLSSLPILMQESFWWWQCSDRCIISLFLHLYTPFHPFSLSLISLVVSVDVTYFPVAYTYNYQLSLKIKGRSL